MHYKDRTLDRIDRIIVEALTDNARLSMRDLAALADMSAPAIKDRLRRLENLQIIDSYTVSLNPRALGYTLQALIRIKPLPGQLHKVQQLIQEMPQCIECDKVTGEDCFVARLWLPSIDDLDPLLAPLAERAETSSSIVKAMTVARRNPPLLFADG